MPNELYLVPVPIFQSDSDVSLSTFIETLNNIDVFVVENLRTARRILRKQGYKKDFDSEVKLIALDKYSDYGLSEEIKSEFKSSKIIGLMSEAGVPCVADPGNKVVMYAHSLSYKVIPLTGSSSILKALMASGMNGQNFAFLGYVPIDKNEKSVFWNKISERALRENQSQLFMEVPHRNDKLIEELLKNIDGNLYLTLAVDIDSPDAFIATKKINQWKQTSIPSFHKRPMMVVVGSL